MLSRLRRVSGVLAGSALFAMSAPAHAGAIGGISAIIDQASGSTVVASCTVKPSGVSLDPSTNPFYVVGHASVVTTKIVVSISLRCRLVDLGTGGSQVGDVQKLSLPGNTVVLAGVIPVSTRGPFKICTYVNAVFSDTTQTNPTGKETCQPVAEV